MKIYANDTFCLYVGFLMAFIGFVATGIAIAQAEGKEAIGLACCLIGISIQFMAFQSKPSDK